MKKNILIALVITSVVSTLAAINENYKLNKLEEKYETLSKRCVELNAGVYASTYNEAMMYLSKED